MKKRYFVLVTVILITIVVLFSGCSSSKSAPSAPGTGDMPIPAPAPESSGISRIFSGSDESSPNVMYDTDTGTPTDDLERKIIKNGNLTIEVKDVIVAIDDITTITNELGGYIVSSNKYTNDETRGMVAIRVPADKFDEAFERIRSIADETPYENKASTDVTEEYTDLEAQLRNLEATEAQYLELLKKAESVEDMVTVQRELSQVRGEIERIEGRMKYIDRTSDMSYIEINIRENQTIAQKKWNPSETLIAAANGFITFLKVLVNVIIWVAIFCPVWIPILVIVIRRRRKKKAMAKQDQVKP
jgi:hypothetical protein